MGIPVKNITGERYGMLVVKSRNFDPQRTTRAYWNCLCDCGNTKVADGVELRNGHITSCGVHCKLKRQKMSELFFDDLTEQRFERWQVVERSYPNGPNGRVMYRCRCDCGNEGIVGGCQLRNGKSLSCGCLQREKTSEANFHDITGNRFGRLVTVKRVKSEVGKTKWLCKCDCGKETTVWASSLHDGNTISCGCYKSERVSEIKLVVLTGKKFGWLVVEERVGTFIEDERTLWKCKCKCGNEVIVDAAHLKSGHTKSCGCFQSLATRSRNQDPKFIAKITAIARDGVNSGTHHSIKHGNYIIPERYH